MHQIVLFGRLFLAIRVFGAGDVVKSVSERDGGKKVIVVIVRISLAICFTRRIGIRNIIEVIEKGFAQAKLKANVIPRV